MNVSSPLKVGQTASFEEERKALRDAFLKRQGLKSPSFLPLPIDASSRRYFRGPGALLMDAPPPHENTLRFHQIADLLSEVKLTVPQVYESDHENGFLLIEDLGDLPYRKAFEKGCSEGLLYKEAVEALAHLHRHQDSKAVELGTYDLSLFLENVGLFLEWSEGPFTLEAKEEFYEVWEEAYKAQPVIPHSFCLRDVMVDNLLWLPNRQGFGRCGFIDFQDGVWGPVSYDLVSLLEDARRDISAQFAEEMVSVYFDIAPEMSQDDFWASYFLWGAQRSTRILGVFSRLSKRDGKHHYLNHTPRVWAYLQRDLSHPQLRAIKDWFEQHVRMK